MVDKIIEQIENYCASVSKPVTAVEFGAAELPAPPYVVVKQERAINGTGFRIIAHFQPGQQKALRQFVRGSLGDALDGFAATNDNGNYNVLQSDWDSVPDTLILNDDNTISLERLYYMGDRLY